MPFVLAGALHQGRGGSLKDLEFYRAAEEWPQPPDDPCTLADLSTETKTKPKEKKSNRRARKKMSESLAGITAAAVAVVVLTSTISPKDFFNEDFLEDKPVVEVQKNTCPTCGIKKCPYYDVYDQVEGLTITFDQEPERLPYDLYALNGFTGDRERNNLYETYEAITTETGKRLILRVDGGAFSAMGSVNSWRLVAYNTNLGNGSDLAISGGGVESEDEKSGDRYSVYMYLAYATDGNLDPARIAEEYGRQPEWAGMDFQSFPVENVPNAQIHVYSDLGQEYVNYFIEYCQVQILEEMNVRYTLGKTMYLQEDNWGWRTFGDLDLGGTSYMVNADADGATQWFFDAYFDIKMYHINYDPITFASVSWLDIFAKWEQLNIAAPALGHKVCFPIHYLGETVVNGITYRCYATYADSDAEPQWCRYMCVPMQEQEILLSFTDRLSEEVMTAILHGAFDGDDVAERFPLLHRITLR